MTRVTVLYQGKLQHEVVAGAHSLVADEPHAAGGDDAGMGPYELLLAALGACTSMTLFLYARRKGMKLEDVRVELTHERVHASDCAGCESDEDARIDRIGRTITLKGELSEDERRRLAEIATRCPVHRTLAGDIRVVDEVALGR